jgi:hypothetical protein
MLCYYAECRILFTIMLNVFMPSVVILNVIMLSVIVPAQVVTFLKTSDWFHALSIQQNAWSYMLKALILIGRAYTFEL